MVVKNEELRDLLIRLKRINKVYGIANEEQKGRIMKMAEPLISQLVGFGFEKEFVEGLLIGGKDFVDSLYGEGNEVASDYDAQIIFA